jgi:hypothetical protein
MRPLSYGPGIVQQDVKYVLRVLSGMDRDAGRNVPQDVTRMHRILGRVEGDSKRTPKVKAKLGESLRRTLTLLLSTRTKKETEELMTLLRLVAKMLINDERSAVVLKKSAQDKHGGAQPSTGRLAQAGKGGDETPACLTVWGSQRRRE